MKRLSFMLIAGEASGDTNAAELVGALRQKVATGLLDSTADVQPLRTALAPQFFGAGGPKMAAAGVNLAFDLTQHSVIGISDVFKNIFKFRSLFHQLVRLALERQPDVIVGVDYGGFNLRFGRAIKQHVRANRSRFNNWNPKIVQFVSPQVWASRPSRAYQLADNYDLLLSIFPFEKEWYARRVPKLRVEFVGHPMVERMQNAKCTMQNAKAAPLLVFLPGSRADEVRRHLPVMVEVARILKAEVKAHCVMVLPNEQLAALAVSMAQVKVFRELSEAEFDLDKHPCIRCLVGNLPQVLAEADLAITKSGTITMECAMLGVPAVVFYKTSWPTYLIARQIVSVKYLAMPNLLAGEEIYPEFVQDAATAENISHAALALLRDQSRRAVAKAKLAEVVASLGGSGAASRAADAILSLMP